MTKFVARFRGEVVGKRKSDRPYKFAVIAQHNEVLAYTAAHNYQATACDRSNFKYYQEIDRLGVNHPHYCVEAWRSEPDHEGIAEARKHLEGGFDAYVARQKANAIAGFEHRKANGHYEPHVAGWSMTRHNAEKMAASYRSAILDIVPADIV